MSAAPQPPRYTTRPLPAYAYVPGRHPHPVRDPRGHDVAATAGQRDAATAAPDALDPQRWSACETYLYAIDLFNHGYFWEAHEALEGLWRQAGRTSRTGLFLQGLIQLAAALLKGDMGQRGPARRLARRGAGKLRGGTRRCCGVDTVALVRAVEDRVEGRGSRAVRIRLEGVPVLGRPRADI